jgi:hypothetical protein
MRPSLDNIYSPPPPVGRDKGEGEIVLRKIYKEMISFCQDGKASFLPVLMPRLGIESQLPNPVEFGNVGENS